MDLHMDFFSLIIGKFSICINIMVMDCPLNMVTKQDT